MSRACCLQIVHVLTIVPQVLPYGMLQVLQYLAASGVSPFEQWFDKLDAQVAAKVTVAVTRMAGGNFGDHKAVGAGVLEHRIDFGPGYRIYFAQAGRVIIVLLAGGDKSTQEKDILTAQRLWKENRDATERFQRDFGA